MLRQLSLLPAGCQPWNSNMLAGTRSKFAYCSTMAVYIYEATAPFLEYKLTSINAEHTKTINSITWNMQQPHLIATCGADQRILVWDVSKQKVIAQLPNLKAASYCIDWMPGSVQPPSVTFVAIGGSLEAWNISTGKVTTMKNITCTRGSKITTFKWHHTRVHTIAFGYLDGSVATFVKDFSSAKKKVIRFTEESETDDKVVILSWDPLSNDYLLVANKRSGLRLVDTSTGDVITTFCLPSRAVSTGTFSWINSAPGMFLTGDRETGVLRLWTVGQEQPLENFRVKPMGFNGIHVLDRAREGRHYDENLARGSSRRKPSQSQPLSHSVPPANVVCTFRDGGVGLYDLQKKKWLFLKDQGHIETIFDCKFKPDDPKMLATASFDGTVKIWSTTDLSPVKTSVGNEGVIYSISWAPENLNCIACATRRNGVFIWDFNKGKVVRRFTEHGNFCVFCVSWNQRDSHRIASASEDCTCVIRRLDGQEKQKLSHPAPVYGCDWSAFDKTMLATSCEDGIVRIWSVSDTANTQCVKELRGHTEKVFNIRWHPLIKGILCSGSDDTTIRIWNVRMSSNPCVGVLTGHKNKVRGLSWNYEIPHLLVSGSWDSTIRLWDVRETEQKCLGVVSDHGADVYGLTSHPSTPFMMASSSRDSTVRLWTLAPTLSILFTKVIVGHPFDDILCKPEEGMEMHSALRLAGKMSKQITDEFKQRPKSLVVKLRWFSELFSATPSLENLWDIACYTLGAKETSLSPEYKSGILHTRHLVKYKSADMQELELSASSKLQGGNRQLESALEKAAAVHLKLGNLRKHCEILKLLGRWETALSLAAGVSLEYWKQLTKEYLELLEESGDNEYLPYRIAIGDAKKCIRDLAKAGDYEDALLIAQSAIEGRMPSPTSGSRKSLCNGDAQNGEKDVFEVENLRDECILNLSRMKYSDGDPYRAAAYKLSCDDPTGAVNSLIQANEPLLALCIGQALKCNTEVMKDAALLLSRKLQGQDHYLFAIELLKSFAGDNVNDTQDWSVLHASCAKYEGSPEHRDNLHTYAGLPTPDKFLEQAKMHQQSGKLKQAMQCFLLSSQQIQGLEIGLDLLCKEIDRDEIWSISNVKDFDAVFCVSSANLTKPDMVGHKNKLLALSAYFGALKAINRGYLSVVLPLFEHAIAMTERLERMSGSYSGNDKAPFPLQSSQLKQYLNAWKKFYSQIKDRSDSLNPEGNEMIETIMRQAEKDLTSDALQSNETIVAGSSLPSHSDVHISTLTNKRISGPNFCLEDDSTVISLNEAIMWARVNPFSPTGSGRRIVPF